MFTGLIEEVGIVRAVAYEGVDLRLRIEAPLITQSLAVGDSVSIVGACQTVVHIENLLFDVISVPETLGKTTLGKLANDDGVNLERAATLATRLGGHIVLGHVDEVGTVERINSPGGSHEFFFRISVDASRYMAPVGSIAVNGVSLTVATIDDTLVKVAIIPHTFEHTTFRLLREGDHVNIETDILAKYVARLTGLAPNVHITKQLSSLGNV